RLPRSGARRNLSDMQGMRGGEKNGAHAGIGHGRLELGRQFKAFGRRKISNQLGLLAEPANDAQAPAFALGCLDDIFSPSAKADHGGIDHGCANGLAGRKLRGGAYSPSTGELGNWVKVKGGSEPGTTRTSTNAG